ncbi:MAG: dTDP-4-dehydrorhamnose reductase, partial [Thermoleophilia bacterium]|nr:dTDP-4-dehydrorhamnose reductase [Thermoleophilia bacterium]
MTGAGGQLGRAALRELGADGIGLRHAELDVTDAAAVLA